MPILKVFDKDIAFICSLNLITDYIKDVDKLKRYIRPVYPMRCPQCTIKNLILY